MWPYRVGETVEFSRGHGDSRKTLGFAKITALQNLSAKDDVVKVVFDKPVPAEWKGALVANWSHRPKVTLKGNYFHDAFNTRLSAFGDYLLEGNRWERAENATYADDLTDYYGECGPIHDFIARNNTVSHMRSWNWGFCLFVKPTGKILFEGNKYISVRRPHKGAALLPAETKGETRE